MIGALEQRKSGRGGDCRGERGDAAAAWVVVCSSLSPPQQRGGERRERAQRQESGVVAVVVVVVVVSVPPAPDHGADGVEHVRCRGGQRVALSGRLVRERGEQRGESSGEEAFLLLLSLPLFNLFLSSFSLFFFFLFGDETHDASADVAGQGHGRVPSSSGEREQQQMRHEG